MKIERDHKKEQEVLVKILKQYEESTGQPLNTHEIPLESVLIQYLIDSDLAKYEDDTLMLWVECKYVSIEDFKKG